MNDHLFQFDGEKMTHVYHVPSDSLLRKDLVSEERFEKEEKFIKAFIQVYNHTLINNKTSYQVYEQEKR